MATKRGGNTGEDQVPPMAKRRHVTLINSAGAGNDGTPTTSLASEPDGYDITTHLRVGSDGRRYSSSGRMVTAKRIWHTPGTSTATPSKNRRPMSAPTPAAPPKRKSTSTVMPELCVKVPYLTRDEVRLRMLLQRHPNQMKEVVIPDRIPLCHPPSSTVSREPKDPREIQIKTKIKRNERIPIYGATGASHDQNNDNDGRKDKKTELDLDDNESLPEMIDLVSSPSGDESSPRATAKSSTTIPSKEPTPVSCDDSSTPQCEQPELEMLPPTTPGLQEEESNPSLTPPQIQSPPLLLNDSELLDMDIGSEVTIFAEEDFSAIISLVEDDILNVQSAHDEQETAIGSQTEPFYDFEPPGAIVETDTNGFQTDSSHFETLDGVDGSAEAEASPFDGAGADTQEQVAGPPKERSSFPALVPDGPLQKKSFYLVAWEGYSMRVIYAREEDVWEPIDRSTYDDWNGALTSPRTG